MSTKPANILGKLLKIESEAKSLPQSSSSSNSSRSNSWTKS